MGANGQQTEIEVREAGIDQAPRLAELFMLHVFEQARIQPALKPNPAFSSMDFIEAMMNPTLNRFFAAWHSDKMIGFARLSILSGDCMIPIDTQVDRLRKSYLKRVPLSILNRMKIFAERNIARMQEKWTVSSIYLPETVGYLADIYVQEEYRGKGVATMLVKRAYKWFRSMGVDKMELFVLEANEKGRKFFKHIGFKDRRILAVIDIPEED